MATRRGHVINSRMVELTGRTRRGLLVTAGSARSLDRCFHQSISTWWDKVGAGSLRGMIRLHNIHLPSSTYQMFIIDSSCFTIFWQSWVCYWSVCYLYVRVCYLGGALSVCFYRVYFCRVICVSGCGCLYVCVLLVTVVGVLNCELLSCVFLESYWWQGRP